MIPAYTDKEITIVPQGAQGIDYGMVTFDSKVSTITVNHSLGVVPKFAVIVPYNVTFLRNDKAYFLGAYKAKKASPNMYNSTWTCTLMGSDTLSNGYAETAIPTADETTINFNTGTSFDYNKGTYYWFAIA